MTSRCRTFKSNEPEEFESRINESDPAHDIHDPKYVHPYTTSWPLLNHIVRDSRSLGNRAAAEKVMESKEQQKSAREQLYERDPTAVARDHGNKPSRGAEVDAELKRDDELRMQEKGIDA